MVGVSTALAPTARRPLRRRLAPRIATALIAITGLTLLAAPAAHAAASYCSPSGDFCTSARKAKGVRTLWIGTFAHRGKVRICVAARDGEPVCRTRTLRRTSGGVYEAQIKWSSNYPRRPKGKRTVTFRLAGGSGHDLGPALTFTAR